MYYTENYLTILNLDDLIYYYIYDIYGIASYYLLYCFFLYKFFSTR